MTLRGVEQVKTGIFSVERPKTDAGMGDPRAGMGDPRAGMGDPRGGATDPCAGISHPRMGAFLSHAGMIDPRAGISDPRAGISDPRAGITNPRAGISHPRMRESISHAGMIDPRSGPDHPCGGPGLEDPGALPASRWSHWSCEGFQRTKGTQITKRTQPNRVGKNISDNFAGFAARRGMSPLNTRF